MDFTSVLKRKKEDGLYYFPQFTQNIVNRINLNSPIFLSGPTGSGKSEFVEYLASVMDKNLYEIDFSVGTTEANIIGRILVENGETKFFDGLLPKAMKEGAWILFDEIDFAEPEHLAVLQQVLAGKPLVITQNKSEVIIPHPDFRIFATANTKGRGDETQSYTGTNVLNISFIDRFSIFEMEYTKKEKEIVASFINDTILIKMLLDLFSLLRKATANEEIINAAFSTRRLIQICKLLSIGETLKDVINFEIVNRFEVSEKRTIKEYIYEIFDKEYYLNGWVLGNKHLELKENQSSEIKKEDEDEDD